MTCSILDGYTSNYVEGCDATLWGEGCEQCIKTINWQWGLVTIGVIAIITLIFFILTKLNKEEIQNGKPKQLSELH